MPPRRLLLAALAICLVAGAPPAAAFRACTKPVTDPSGPLFISDNCNDQLPDASPPPPSCGGLSDVAFWYFAHVNHHDPCAFLPLCDPALGTVAFGPTIRLVGRGW